MCASEKVQAHMCMGMHAREADCLSNRVLAQQGKGSDSRHHTCPSWHTCQSGSMLWHWCPRLHPHRYLFSRSMPVSCPINQTDRYPQALTAPDWLLWLSLRACAGTGGPCSHWLTWLRLVQTERAFLPTPLAASLPLSLPSTPNL